MTSSRVRFAFAAAAVLFTIHCSSAPAHVDMKEPSRVLGREDNVRIDAQMLGELANNSTVQITYEIENLRDASIAFAEQVPSVGYDVYTRTVTVTIGSEIPGTQHSPHLVELASGEKRTFVTSAHISIPRPQQVNPFFVQPLYVRLKLCYLADVKPFENYIELAKNPQPAQQAKMAGDLFAKWIENNQTVLTNAVPLDWNTSSTPAPATDMNASQAAPSGFPNF